MAHIGTMFSSYVFSGYVAEHGIYETLRKIHEIGYHYLEVSQLELSEANIAELERGCNDFDIKVRSFSAYVHVSDELKPFGNPESLDREEDFRKMVALCRRFGCKIIRQGALPGEVMGSYEKILEFAKQADEIALRLEEEGIGFYFHAHNLEFHKYHGVPLLYTIRDNTTALGFELDTFWIQAGGMVPAQVISDFAGRIRLLHLKDWRVKVAKSISECSDMNCRTGIIQFAEVGEGNINMPACIQAGLDNGCEYFFIEQDSSYDRTAVESAAISYRNLVAMGYGDML